MADPSFDVVSKVDRQEVDNAVNQAAKEVSNRFDFRDTGASVAWSGDAVAVSASTEDRCKAAFEVFQEKAIRRGISLKALTHGDPQPASKSFRMTVDIVQGIDEEKARAIAKAVRADGPKGIQAAVQGDQLRVSGKKKDDLQAVIALLKSRDFGIPLQFTNYR